MLLGGGGFGSILEIYFEYRAVSFILGCVIIITMMIMAYGYEHIGLLAENAIYEKKKQLNLVHLCYAPYTGRKFK